MPQIKGMYADTLRRTFAWKQLCKGVIFERNSRLIFAVFAIIIGGFFFLFPAGHEASNIWLKMLGCLFFILAGGLTVIAGRIWNPEESEALQTLLNQPERIVWVYTVITEKMPYGFMVGQSGHIFFKLIDGNSHVVAIPAEHLVRVSSELNDFLPHATFGYSRDKEQWYMVDPHLLIIESE